MIVDGKKIAAAILQAVANEVSTLERAPRLSIITCTPNFETQKYLTLKKRTARDIGIHTNVIELLSDCTTDDVIETIKVAAGQSDGMIVQLPLPAQLDTDKILAAVPMSHDVDAIHYAGEGDVLPPVVGAIAAIADLHEVDFVGKKLTIIGAGRLVGAPALLWTYDKPVTVTLVTHETLLADKEAAIRGADIIISGAGQPRLLTPENIKPGVVLFDAGTTEDGGALVGDADPACAEHASLFTPVPGGIGPITIAYLLKNLVSLMRQ